MRKTVITCAITGAATSPDQTPHLPITPEQIANSALEAAEAGAAVAHIHVRNIKTGRPSMDLELYQEVIDRIKSKNTDLIINLTTGPGALFRPAKGRPGMLGFGSVMLKAHDRVKHIEVLKPEICSIDFNTMNLKGEGIRINQVDVIRDMLQIVQLAGTKPELEIFDSGDMRLAMEMLDAGIIHRPPLIQFAMGIKYGWEASHATLQYAYGLLPKDAIWTAFGIGRDEMPMVAMTQIFGGHVRIGMEDNIYLKKGVLAKTNAELVRMAVQLIETLGGEIANCKEARELLGLDSSGKTTHPPTDHIGIFS
jgi:uncharacterized protein (DUF849 family)